jgi:hypothetical protein
MTFSFEDIQKFNKENTEKFTAAFNTFTKTSQAIATEVTEFAKKSYEANQAAVEKISGVKTLDKAIEVQTDVAKTSYDAAVAKTAKIGEIYAEFAKEAVKPFEAAFATFSKNVAAVAPKAAK